ncbi:MAG: hypothetical protein JKY61_07340 [Planctomycetes bacterium]|nr:hypothetical protein [Planctomycetota bacterium]
MRNLLLLLILLCPSVFAQSDDCSNAPAISGQGSWTFDTTTFTTSQFNGGGCKLSDADINQDGFFAWTSTFYGQVTLNTFGSDFDTRLRLHRGGDCAATCLEHNDDAWSLQSAINFQYVAPGETYLIQIGGLGNASGQVVLNIHPSGCGSNSDDIYEDNDTFPTAALMPPGSYRGLTVKATDPDFFNLTVPAGQRALISASPTTYPVDLTLLAPSGALLVTVGDPFGVDKLWIYENTTAAPRDLVLMVGTLDPVCRSYGFEFNTELAGCMNRPDDLFEENDTCATAARLVPGIYKGLLGSESDADVYEVLVPAGMVLNVVGSMPGLVGSIGGYRRPGMLDCSQNNATADFIGNHARYANDTGVTQNVLFVVSPGDLIGGECYEYQLSVHLDPDYCGSLLPDGLDQTGQSWLEDGAYPNLGVDNRENDIYDICIPDGGVVHLGLSYNSNAGTLEARLWDNDSGRLLGWTGSQGVASPLIWANDESREVQGRFEVRFSSGLIYDCIEYDLTVQGTCGCHKQVGESFCTPSANSQFPNGSWMTGDLDCGAAARDLVLRVQQGPPNQFGYFLMAANSAEPGVSIGSGELCLSGAVVRFHQGNSTNSLGQFNSVGSFESLTGNGDATGSGFNVPIGFPYSGTLITAGDTWHFQLWHRDLGGASNFSSGLSVVF